MLDKSFCVITHNYNILNLQGKLFCIDFINTVSFSKLEVLLEEGYEFNYELRLSKAKIAISDLKHLLNNHLGYVKGEDIVLSLLINNIKKSEKGTATNSDFFMVTINQDSLYFLKELLLILKKKTLEVLA